MKDPESNDTYDQPHILDPNDPTLSEDQLRTLASNGVIGGSIKNMSNRYLPIAFEYGRISIEQMSGEQFKLIIKHMLDLWQVTLPSSPITMEDLCDLHRLDEKYFELLGFSELAKKYEQQLLRIQSSRNEGIRHALERLSKAGLLEVEITPELCKVIPTILLHSVAGALIEVFDFENSKLLDLSSTSNAYQLRSLISDNKTFDEVFITPLIKMKNVEDKDTSTQIDFLIETNKKAKKDLLSSQIMLGLLDNETGKSYDGPKPKHVRQAITRSTIFIYMCLTAREPQGGDSLEVGDFPQFLKSVLKEVDIGIKSIAMESSFRSMVRKTKEFEKYVAMRELAFQLNSSLIEGSNPLDDYSEMMNRSYYIKY